MNRWLVVVLLSILAWALVELAFDGVVIFRNHPHWALNAMWLWGLVLPFLIIWQMRVMRELQPPGSN